MSLAHDNRDRAPLVAEIMRTFGPRLRVGPTDRVMIEFMLDMAVQLGAETGSGCECCPATNHHAAASTSDAGHNRRTAQES